MNNDMMPMAELSTEPKTETSTVSMPESDQPVVSNTIEFTYSQTTEESQNIIKVVGVGGGGSNAVENMYKEGIQDVTFLLINTDKAALKRSPVPHKLQISKEGLGAGAQPDKAYGYATEYEDAIRTALNDGTKMVFITAGMGGGTGTGASPVVAKIARELGILTIGIVTVPFQFEGMRKINMALEGVASIRQYVDALLVVNNNRLIEVYPDLNFFNAFKKADDTLTVAAKSISDIINKVGYMNLDFADVEKTLKDSGVALISTGTAHGEKRVTQAIQAAISSPLLQDNDIENAKHLLFNLCFSHSNPVEMQEIGELTSFVESLNPDIEVIWGSMFDDTLGDDVRLIVLASGFDITDDGQVRARQVMLEEDRKAAEAAAAAAEKARQEQEAAAAAAAERARQEQEAAAAEKARQEQEAAAAAERARQEQEAAAAAERVRLEQEAAAAAEKARQEQEAAAAAEKARQEQEAAAAAAEPLPSVQQPQTSAPVVVEPIQQPQRPAAAASPIEGIEQIRKYYGEEVANGMAMDQRRKYYYLLDNNDLSNEQLIALLETMPAYNRTAQQLSDLKTASSRGNIPLPKHDEVDGTIHF